MNNKTITYDNIISLENIHQAWREFVNGKKNRNDVADFMLRFSNNTYNLQDDLKNKTYIHGPYEAFSVNDPKPRSIHKASVRDRLVHHAIYRILYPYFDQKFIYDSYSCRDFKGTHRALDRFRRFIWEVSRNDAKTCWVLKCDIKKFFASIDHAILIEIIKRHIADSDIVWLIQKVVESFQSTGPGKGLPLGNLTSQLLVNVYMNEFDQFVKYGLKQRYYIRYADDFVIMDRDRGVLMEVLAKVHEFLEENLKLKLHPDKTFFQTASSGIDFLGWVHFPDHRVLRTTTKKRMFRRLIASDGKMETVQSYLGMISHGNSKKLKNIIEANYKKAQTLV
ncbi:MAG: reverse transcriptase/maturase family protein [Candidatus Taylorbacteria bacterium]|nr:reverse transcriptase/maturase family protein [Candidatus Taylorbacteria bacterium]